MERDTTVETLIRHSDAALRVQTAKAQQLQHALADAETEVAGLKAAVSALQRENGDLLRERDTARKVLRGARAVLEAASVARHNPYIDEMVRDIDAALDAGATATEAEHNEKR